MGLFVCDECNVVENTATAGLFGYHGRNIKPGEIDIDRNPKLADVKGDGKARCSQCNPQIGKWHGVFPREEWDGKRAVLNRSSDSG